MKQMKITKDSKEYIHSKILNDLIKPYNLILITLNSLNPLVLIIIAIICILWHSFINFYHLLLIFIMKKTYDANLRLFITITNDLSKIEMVASIHTNIHLLKI